MGPVVTARRATGSSGYIDQGVEAGATPVVDGRERSSKAGDGFLVGPTLFDHVQTDMSIYTDEIFGPVLSVVRVPTLEAAIDLINANSVRQRHRDLHLDSGQAARIFQRKVQVGMIGINVPIPVPMAFYSFGGWKDSLFGDHHIHGRRGSASTRAARRSPAAGPRRRRTPAHHGGHMHFPTAV